MLYCTSDKEYFARDYQDPGLPDTGIAADSLKDALQDFLNGKNFATSLQEHTEAFDFLLKHIRIGVSPEDLFVTLGFWGRKPIEQLIMARRYREIEENECAGTLELKNNFIQSGYGSFFLDYAHNVPDWKSILTLGFPGLLKRAEEAEQKFYAAHDGNVSDGEREFFASVKKEYTLVLELLDRICVLAEREHCQSATVKALHSLRTGAPGSFYECMLLIWLYYQLSEYGDCVQTRSFGNLDAALISYYRADLASGAFREEDIRTVVRNFYFRVSAMKYQWEHPFYMGGTLPDGSSAYNELSVLMLEEYGKMGIYDPKLQLKIAENTPEHILDQALELIRSGSSSIAFVGEKCIRETMLRYGYTEEEARTAVVKGCYEYCPPATAVETAPCIVNLPRILLQLLRKNEEAATFEELFDACLEDMKKILDQGMSAANDFEQYYDRINPVPLFSGTSETALGKGMDCYCRGSKYNNSNVWLSGPVTAVDSLIMIRKYVYERREITLKDLLAVLDKDWEGAEKLFLKIRRDPDHFGNNRPADEMAVRFLESLADHINFRQNSRGGFYTTALHCANYYVFYGKQTGATPDGRRAGEELTKNITPRLGSSCSGVTALVTSALKLDPGKFMADFPVDVMLHPSAVAGKEGLIAMRALLMTYIKGGGHAIHFNVFSSKLLEDARKDPEKYQDLQVRVCGWNVLWNNLSGAEQERYLEQAKANEGIC